MFTDDINFLSVILKRPLRVLYCPQKEQFGNSESGQKAYEKLIKETGGLAMLEFKGNHRDSEQINYAYAEY